jgi:hypothetical protein
LLLDLLTQAASVWGRLGPARKAQPQCDRQRPISRKWSAGHFAGQCGSKKDRAKVKRENLVLSMYKIIKLSNEHANINFLIIAVNLFVCFLVLLGSAVEADG